MSKIHAESTGCIIYLKHYSFKFHTIHMIHIIHIIHIFPPTDFNATNHKQTRVFMRACHAHRDLICPVSLSFPTPNQKYSKSSLGLSDLPDFRNKAQLYPTLYPNTFKYTNALEYHDYHFHDYDCYPTVYSVVGGSTTLENPFFFHYYLPFPSSSGNKGFVFLPPYL